MKICDSLRKEINAFENFLMDDLKRGFVVKREFKTSETNLEKNHVKLTITVDIEFHEQKEYLGRAITNIKDLIPDGT
jgi:hypothetical protein